MKTNAFFSNRLLLPFLLGLSVLAGCATTPPRLYATVEEAVVERGEPTRSWDNHNGTKTLEFSTQPNGTSCLMLETAENGSVLRQWDALSDQSRAQVKAGMTQDEVLRQLGTQRSMQTFPNSAEVVWTWNVRAGSNVTTLFNVHFADGKVIRTSYDYDYRDYYDPWGPWYRDYWGPWGPWGGPWGYRYW